MEALVLLLLGVLLFIVLLDWMWKPKLDLPYPSRIPVVGHMLSFLKNQHMTLTRWSESCGDVYCIQILSQTFVIISGYEAAREVLVTRGKEFGGRLNLFRLAFISKNGKGIAFQSASPKWKQLRLLVHQNIRQYGDDLGRIEDTVCFTRDICFEFDECVLDPYDKVYLTMASNMITLLTGKPITADDPMFQKIIHAEHLGTTSLTLDKGAELDVLPWLRFFGNKTFRAIKVIANLQSDIYRSIKMMYHKGELVRDSLAFVLIDELQDSNHRMADVLSDDIVEVVIFELLMAGLSSSAATLYVFILLMAHFDQVQMRVHAEILRCLSAKDQDGKISLMDRNNMPYTRACLLEVMRYASITPLTLDHTALLDTEVSGHKIPKGTPVFVNLFGLHHSPKYWDQPWSFNPERFLSEDGQLLPSDHVNRKMMLPFGCGIRSCIGQSLAQARFFILATSLIRDFQISPVPGETIKPDPREFELRMILNAPRAKLKFKRRL